MKFMVKCGMKFFMIIHYKNNLIFDGFTEQLDKFFDIINALGLQINRGIILL